MRSADWPEILEAKMREWDAIPFAWGTTDCAMFVIDVVNAMTGMGIVNRSLGTYDTQGGALRAIRALGDDLSALVSERFGDSIPVAFAQRGDALLFQGNLGICVGEVSMFRTPEGLLKVDTLKCERAWRVG